MAVDVFRGVFGPAQAERLLWRAGTGPLPGEPAQLAAKGLEGAVRTLTRPQGKTTLTGPEPHGDGRSLHPRDRFADGHLWWLDRMVRTNHPMSERMTLVWHDWFATSEVGTGPRWMMDQYATLHRNALGNFGTLLHDITIDPAMLVWLSGVDNHKGAPNENYGREMMELFTLGADRGYTERDVREQARALSGFGWKSPGPTTTYRPQRHDDGIKTIFGKRGRFDWRDSVRLVLQHPKHPSFFVTKLWSYFVPTAPDAATQAALESLYRSSGRNIRTVVEAILMHPALYEGPRMVKPPVIQIAGMLRHLGEGVTTDDWSWLSAGAGQQLFVPPDVSGWDDSRWLDTSTWRGRWLACDQALKTRAVTAAPLTETPAQALAAALAFWGNPTLTTETLQQLLAFAVRSATRALTHGDRAGLLGQRQNALRMLIANSPDMQTC